MGISDRGRESLPPGKRIDFRIGAIFSADDPVARFLTGVSMNTNDLIRIQTLVGRNRETGMVLLLARINASLLWEIGKFVQQSRRRIPPVRAFLESLAPATQSELARGMDGLLRPQQSDFGRDVEFLRNHSFHYPELAEDRPDPDAIGRALAAIADYQGSIAGEQRQHFRFHFADQVVMRLLTPREIPAVEELRPMFREFTDRTDAFVSFADGATAAFLSCPSRLRQIHLTPDERG